MLFSTILATLVASAAAGGTAGRTFAVMHFYGDGPLVTARVDPILQPGGPSQHLHTVMGASNFGFDSTGESLLESNCTNSLIKGDLSNYWVPTLFFKSPVNGSLIQVPLFYMNVYYFFEGTNDNITAFPVGLQMLSGNAMLRTAPVTTGEINLDPSQGTVQPTQWTCPRSSYNPLSYPVGSDGSTAGIQDPTNLGSGMGFPFENCDGYASPLRMDLHFPSCYNPAAGLTNYMENMAFPTNAGNNLQDCPPGWIHTPHIFFEVYWNTPLFVNDYDNWGNGQPFVLSEGDLTGYSAHGDFMSGWNETVLQQIIDNCNAGDSGMDKCPGLLGGVNDPSDTCNIPSPVDEVTTGWLSQLPGDNPLAGWGVGDLYPTVPGMSGSSPTTAVQSSSSAAQTAPVSSSAAAVSSSAAAVSSSAAAVSSSAAAVSSSTKVAESASSSSSSSATETAASTTLSTSVATSAITQVAQQAPPTTTSEAEAATTQQAGAGAGAGAGSGGNGVLTDTIWDTVTVWTTATVWETEPTAAPMKQKQKRHVADHAHRHRAGLAARRR